MRQGNAFPQKSRRLMMGESQHVCGVSVLDNSFERLKRLNIAEIYDATPVVEPTAVASRIQSQ